MSGESRNSSPSEQEVKMQESNGDKITFLDLHYQKRKQKERGTGNGLRLHRLVNQAIDFCTKSADNLDANGVERTTKTTTTMMMISKLGSALHRPSMDRSIPSAVYRLQSIPTNSRRTQRSCGISAWP